MSTKARYGRQVKYQNTGQISTFIKDQTCLIYTNLISPLNGSFPRYGWALKFAAKGGGQKKKGPFS